MFFHFNFFYSSLRLSFSPRLSQSVSSTLDMTDFTSTFFHQFLPLNLSLTFSVLFSLSRSLPSLSHSLTLPVSLFTLTFFYQSFHPLLHCQQLDVTVVTTLRLCFLLRPIRIKTFLRLVSSSLLSTVVIYFFILSRIV